MSFDRFQKKLGSRLLEIRQAKRLTQQAVAEASGVTRQHLQRLEAGAGNPRARTLFALARVYKLSPSELVAV